MKNILYTIILSFLFSSSVFAAECGEYNPCSPTGLGTSKDGTVWWRNRPYTGKYTFTAEKGLKKEEGSYKDGLRDGYWAFYDNNEEKFLGGNYIKGKMDGIWITWIYPTNFKELCEDSKSRIAAECTSYIDLYGERKGSATWYYDNGRKKVEVNFEIDGEQRSTWWYKNGQKRVEINYKPGETRVTEWYENGQKFYEGGLGSLGDSTYVMLNAAHVQFKLDEQRNVDFGDGLWTWWYENGQKKMEGNFKNSMKDGLWTWWYKNGNKKREGKFVDGRCICGEKCYGDSMTYSWYMSRDTSTEDGRWTYWYENGQKKKEVDYRNATRAGIYKEWDENGNIIKSETFLPIEGYIGGEKETEFTRCTDEAEWQDWE